MGNKAYRHGKQVCVGLTDEKESMGTQEQYTEIGCKPCRLGGRPPSRNATLARGSPYIHPVSPPGFLSTELQKNHTVLSEDDIEDYSFLQSIQGASITALVCICGSEISLMTSRRYRVDSNTLGQVETSSEFGFQRTDCDHSTELAYLYIFQGYFLIPLQLPQHPAHNFLHL
jgi:hypothetical protein